MFIISNFADGYSIERLHEKKLKMFNNVFTVREYWRIFDFMIVTGSFYLRMHAVHFRSSELMEKVNGIYSKMMACLAKSIEILSLLGNKNNVTSHMICYGG